MSRSPRVSIGVPVYNGERYLGLALESLRAQTFEDLEIVIVDNASTDGTEEIVRDFVRQEPRARYYRNDHNIGAVPNFARAFELSRGEFFKWMGHDDLCAPEYIEWTVQRLVDDSSSVLCQTWVRVIDEGGQVVQDDPAENELTTSPVVHERAKGVVTHSMWLCYEVLGVIRSSILRQTPLIGNFPLGDRFLLLALAIHGRFNYLSEYLFLHRSHPGSYSFSPYSGRAALRGPIDAARELESLVARNRWCDPAKKDLVIFPNYNLIRECLKFILLAPLTLNERMRCCAEIARYAYWFRPVLSREWQIGRQATKELKRRER